MGVLIPGTTSWREALPIFLVAVALLFVPGMAAALLMRLRLLAAAAIAPVLSTTFITVSGVAAALLGIPWRTVPMLVSLAVSAVAVGFAGRYLGQRTPGDDRRLWLAVLGGLLVAGAIVAVSVRSELASPEAIPQHPDTIFHLGAAQWMAEHANISTLDAAGFATPSGTGFYPAAFHAFTASITILTGSSVVVATSVFVLAVVALAWPLGSVALALTLLGKRPVVALTTAVVSVAFTGYPYLLMGFGVLWPNLFGQALLPISLALVAVVLGVLTDRPYLLANRRQAVLLFTLCLPALVLAHPNAFVTLCLFALLMVAGRLAGLLRRPRGVDPREWLLHGAVVVGAVLVAGVATWLRPAGMFATGAKGPEASTATAWEDLLLFSPRMTKPLLLLSIVVAIGLIAILVRHRGARWLIAALTIMLGLFWLNVAVDSESVRYLTWPWYNNAVRLQAPAILPAVIAAGAGLTVLADLATRLLPFRAGTVVATAAILAAFLVATGGGYLYPHEHILHRYFHPQQKDSWATPAELRALHELSARLPSDAVVAANPWNGGTYLYVVSGRRLLVPTEKANTSPDRELLSLRLDEVGTDPAVCAAAEREHVDWAITGGDPFAWVRDRMRLYVGIDRVGSSPAWRAVATAPPYTLYERGACAPA